MHMYIYSTCEVRSLIDPLLWSLCGEASVFTDPRLPKEEIRRVRRPVKTAERRDLVRWLFESGSRLSFAFGSSSRSSSWLLTSANTSLRLV